MTSKMAASSCLLLQLFLLTLVGSELAKAASDCDGTFNCCCLNGGTAEVIEDCCECTCPDGFSGDFCEVVESEKKIAKYTFSNGNNPYWSLTMSSEERSHPIRKSLRRKRNKGSFDNFATFNVGDQKPTMTFRFRGDGEKELQFLEGQFITSMAGSSVVVSALDEDGQELYIVETFTFAQSLNKYENWAYSFTNPDVQGVQFTFSSSCKKKNCFGINNMFGFYILGLADPLTCDGHDCGAPDLAAYFDNGCCNCTVVG